MFLTFIECNHKNMQAAGLNCETSKCPSLRNGPGAQQPIKKQSVAWVTLQRSPSIGTFWHCHVWQSCLSATQWSSDVIPKETCLGSATNIVLEGEATHPHPFSRFHLFLCKLEYYQKFCQTNHQKNYPKRNFQKVVLVLAPSAKVLVPKLVIFLETVSFESAVVIKS